MVHPPTKQLKQLIPHELFHTNLLTTINTNTQMKTKADIIKFLETEQQQLGFINEKTIDRLKFYFNTYFEENTSLPSASPTTAGESKEGIINKGIVFANSRNTDNESYRSGAGFGYSCGYEDAMNQYASQSTPSASFSLEVVEKLINDLIKWIPDKHIAQKAINNATEFLNSLKK